MITLITDLPLHTGHLHLSLFLEAVRLLPQYVLFSGSNDESTWVATIICSLSFVAVTVAMLKLNLIWGRGVWAHGASMAYLVVGGCLVSVVRRGALSYQVKFDMVHVKYKAIQCITRK